MKTRNRFKSLIAAMLLVVPATAMVMPQAQAVDTFTTVAEVFGVASDCVVGASAPVWVNGQIRAPGSMTCSRTYTLVLQVCIQINESNTEEGWVPFYCGPPVTKTGTSVNTTATGPCPTTALYRTHVFGQAYTSQGVLVSQGTAVGSRIVLECPLLP